MNKHLSLASQTLLTARRNGLRAGQDNTVVVLVRVQAPDAPKADAAARPPQAIALVIDRSGSMSGRPLAEARRCAEFVVSRLRPTDCVSVVQFDNRVQRLWPAVPLADGNAVRTAIGSIDSGGNTNLHGGWLDGADSLDSVPGAGLKRVILLSDGCANEGLTDSAEIAAQCATWAAQGVTTSTYGLGDNFNEDLMVAMARAGGGNHYYGDKAEDLMEPFQQELDLLANLALQQVEMRVSAADGLRVEMLNELSTVEAGWRLPDLAWGAEAWAILRVTVPAGALPVLGDRMSVLRVSVTGQSLQGEAVVLEKAGLVLPVLSPSAFDALVEDELVQRRCAELAAGLFLAQMRSAAHAHDWAAVDGMLTDARKRFAGNEWVAGILEAMAALAQGRSRERVMKEARYAAARLNTRLAAKDEVAFSMVADAGPAYLRRKRQQGKGEV